MLAGRAVLPCLWQSGISGKQPWFLGIVERDWGLCLLDFDTSDRKRRIFLSVVSAFACRLITGGIRPAEESVGSRCDGRRLFVWGGVQCYDLSASYLAFYCALLCADVDNMGIASSKGKEEAGREGCGKGASGNWVNGDFVICLHVSKVEW